MKVIGVRNKAGWAFLLALGAFLSSTVYGFSSAESPSGGLVSPEAAESFSPVGFRVGDNATYQGASGHTVWRVHAPHEIPDRSGRMVAALPVRLEFSQPPSYTFEIGLATGLLEALEVTCSVLESGNCLPWIATDWRYQGLPGVWGASGLQGRTFAVGDSWTLDGDCQACGSTSPRFRVEAPGSDSPPGTLYVVHISGVNPLRSPEAWIFPEGRIHMGGDHAFPLRADIGAASFALSSFTAGSGDAVEFSSPPLQASYPPLLSAGPFHSDGRPAEGSPREGWVSWSEARVAAGIPPLAAGETFVKGKIEMGQGYQDNPVVGRFNWSDWHQWEEHIRSLEHEGQDRILSYRRERQFPDVAPLQGLFTTWTSSEQSEPAVYPDQCLLKLPKATAPIWETVAEGLTRPYLTAFSSVEIQPACSLYLADYEVLILGAGHPQSWEFFPMREVFSVEAGTARALYAFHWPKDIPP